MAKPKSIHYIDNEKFLKEMVIYKRELDEAKSKDELPPMISEYLGDCFMKIAQRLSFRPNFINYAFKDEMISDGIENCVQYIHNFDPDKSKNPFAYFTQVIHYAFLRRIQKEKKQLDIKTKIIEKTGYDEVMMVDDSLLSGNSSEYNSIKDAIQYRNNNR